MRFPATADDVKDQIEAATAFGTNARHSDDLIGLGARCGWPKDLRISWPAQPPQDLVRDVSDRPIVGDDHVADAGTDATREPPARVAHIPRTADRDRIREPALDLIERQGQPHDAQLERDGHARGIEHGVRAHRAGEHQAPHTCAGVVGRDGSEVVQIGALHRGGVELGCVEPPQPVEVDRAVGHAG